MRFHDWEIAVLDALAQESLAQLKDKTFVRYEDRFLEKVTRDLQDEFAEPKERSSLMAHARRLEIGPGRHRQPPRIEALHLDDHVVAEPEVASAWQAAILSRLRPSALDQALERAS